MTQSRHSERGVRLVRRVHKLFQISGLFPLGVLSGTAPGVAAGRFPGLVAGFENRSGRFCFFAVINLRHRRGSTAPSPPLAVTQGDGPRGSSPFDFRAILFATARTNLASAKFLGMSGASFSFVPFGANACEVMVPRPGLQFIPTGPLLGGWNEFVCTVFSPLVSFDVVGAAFRGWD